MRKDPLLGTVNEYFEGLRKREREARAQADGLVPVTAADLVDGVDWVKDAEAIAQEMDDQVESRLADLGDPSDHA